MVHTLLYKTFFNKKYPIWFGSMLKDFIRKKLCCSNKLLPKLITINILYYVQSENFNPNSIIIINYIFNIQNSIKTNLDYFGIFLTVKNLVHPFRFIEGKEIVDCFAHYFSSVYENQVTSTINTH